MPPVILKESLDLAPEPGARIVRREEYADWVGAEDERAAVTRLRGRLRERAAKAHSREIDQARREARAEADQVCLERMIAFSRAAVAELEALESRVEGLAAEAVRRLLGSLSVEERLGAIVEELLAEAEDEQRLTVSVHPDDYAALKRALADRSQGQPVLRVRRDDALPLDCVRVEGALGIVETNVARYLAALADEPADFG